MKVLVVEDEHKIGSSIKRGFEQESWAVDLAFDGETGFDMAMSESYDVIVLDLMLPKMNGLEVCKKLRSEGKHTPVLMLTAKGEMGDKMDGFDSGADDYLVKPFAFEELLARVKAIGRRPPVIRKNVLTSGDVSLDTTNFVVKKSGNEVALSKKEYSLLEFFIKNKGKVLSKESIISHVWDYDADILPNTIEVFVGYLRNKLGKDFIQTVRGFGYKIN